MGNSWKSMEIPWNPYETHRKLTDSHERPWFVSSLQYKYLKCLQCPWFSICFPWLFHGKPWHIVSYFVPHFKSLPTTVYSAVVLPQTTLHVEFTEVHGTPWRTHGFAVISVQFRGVTAQTDSRTPGQMLTGQMLTGQLLTGQMLTPLSKNRTNAHKIWFRHGKFVSMDMDVMWLITFTARCTIVQSTVLPSLSCTADVMD